MAINAFDGKIVSVIGLPMGSEAISVISMRAASKRVYEPAAWCLAGLPLPWQRFFAIIQHNPAKQAKT